MLFAKNLKLLALLVAVLSAGFVAGCRTGNAIPPGTRYMVTSPRAQFYKYGPAQSFGADFVLAKGQRVIILERSFGFDKVMTDDGVSGWVASEDLAQAPPEPRVASTALASTKRRSGSSGGAPDRMYSGPRRSSNVEPVSGDPLFDMSDLPPPPLPENPEKPKPALRGDAPKPKE